MEIKQQNGRQIIDYMARDYESLLESMRRLAPEKLPEWADYRKETDFGNVLLQLFAHMGDIVSYYQDRLVNESFLGTAQERRSIIQHLRLIGYRLATAAPAATTLTLQFPVGFNATVRVSDGNAFATKSSKDAPSIRYEYIGPAIDIDCSLLLVDAASGKKHYDIQVEEGRLIAEDILGVSDGSSNQRFDLGFTGLILRAFNADEQTVQDITVWTDLGGVIDDEWRLQESLAFSRDNQKDFSIEIDEDDQASLLFGGNGLGAVPPSGALIKARYRVGGGAAGNKPAGSINTIVDAPALTLAGATVINFDAATGGSARESIEHAVTHAPQVFRSLKRAVTAADYKALALNFKGVGKVRAEATHWNRVTLYVAPEGGGRVSDILVANLLAYFEDKRPLSTLIEIEDVDYVKIYVAAKVGIGSYYSRIEMREKIAAAAADLLAFEQVDFGQLIYLSKFYEAIESLTGVEYVTVTEFRREGVAGAEDEPGKIKLRPNELPRIPGSAVEDGMADAAYRDGLNIIEIEGGY